MYNCAMDNAISISKLIQKAEYLLKKQPYDVAHDLTHHQRVWKNAETIVERENLRLNSDALKVACYWHDVVLEAKDEEENRDLHIAETLAYLKSFMQEEKIDVEFQQIVQDAVSNHGFEKKRQLNLEGEVLFDADKLDALNPERYTVLLAQLKDKQLSKIKIFMYRQAAKIWLTTMRYRYHFESSREIHDEKISELLQNTEIVEAAKKIGINISELIR